MSAREDGLFPSARAIGEPEEMEEERRLCYVAITRAKRRLTITCAHQRMLYGRTTVSRPSRFLCGDPGGALSSASSTRSRASCSRPPPGPRPTMPHSDTLGSHHASGPVIDFRKGDTVEHDVFGRGLVLSVLPTGNDKMLEIAFDQIGTKRLMANLPPRACGSCKEHTPPASRISCRGWGQNDICSGTACARRLPCCWRRSSVLVLLTRLHYAPVLAQLAALQLDNQASADHQRRRAGYAHGGGDHL